MFRRNFFTLIGGAAATLQFSARPHAEGVRRIGILLFSQQDRIIIKPLFEELEAHGYLDGKTIQTLYRDAEGNYERLPQLAAELVRLSPDVLFAYSGELAPVLKEATATIPIVVVVSNDPVESKLVASLARPGGNITGLTFVYDQLAGKAIELLKEVAPSISRVAVLWNPNHADPEFRETQRGARALRIQLQSLEVRNAKEFDGAFEAVVRERAEALIVIGSRIIVLHQRQIGDFAERNGLILVGNPGWLTQVGGLLSYGANVADLTRRAASYVEKIFKGAKPADLPFQQPTTFDLVINLKAAKALNLSIPQSLLARADMVME
jgi:ABC-type uncharacterized transport system substrate-binding protein